MVQQREEQRREVEQRRVRMARLHEQNPDITHAELAAELGVTTKTVQRDVAVLKQDGLWMEAVPLPAVPVQQRLMNDVVDQVFDAYSTAKKQARNIEEALSVLRDEMGFDRVECECCGRKNIANDPLKWQAIFKGFDSMKNMLELLAKITGQLDPHIYVIQQADQDVDTIIKAVMTVDRELGKRIVEELVLSNRRRVQRIGEYESAAIDAPFRVLPAPAPPGEEDY